MCRLCVRALLKKAGTGSVFYAPIVIAIQNGRSYKSIDSKVADEIRSMVCNQQIVQTFLDKAKLCTLSNEE